jgi:hypothetical protein
LASTGEIAANKRQPRKEKSTITRDENGDLIKEDYSDFEDNHSDYSNPGEPKGERSFEEEKKEDIPKF